MNHPKEVRMSLLLENVEEELEKRRRGEKRGGGNRILPVQRLKFLMKLHMRKYRSVKMRAFCQFFFCNFLFCSRYCFYFFLVSTLVPQYLYNFYNLRSVSSFMAGRVIIRTVPCKERTLSLFNSLNKKIRSGCGFATFPHTVLHSHNVSPVRYGYQVLVSN